MQNKNGFQANFAGDIIFGIPGKDGGYYLVNAEQINANTLRLTFIPSQDGMALVDPVNINLPGATDAQIQKIVQEYLQNNPAIGQPGKDGFSPIAKVAQTEDGAKITITDKDGTTEVFIANGRNGYTPQKDVDYFDGEDGVTPEFTIGTVNTLDAGSNATASISGTKENPVLNLGIPQGLPGEGGTGGAQWRLCYVKLTDDVSSVTITEDIDGNPIEATEIQCYLISDFLHQNGSSVNGSIQMEINGVYIGEQFAGVLATGKPYSNIYYDAVTGEMRWVQAGLENGNGTVTGRTKAFPSETPIRSITFSWMHPDWLLKSGSEIKCWVR